MRALVLATLFLLQVGAAHAAGPKSFVICDMGGLGSQEEVQPYIDGFGKYLTAKLGWSRQDLDVRFVAGYEACRSELQRLRPQFAAVPLEIYLSSPADLGIRPLVSTLIGGAPAGSYRLLVKKGTKRAAAELAGAKTACTASDKTFIEKIVVAGALPAGLRFEQPPRLLRALRSLAGGRDWDAALLDEGQYRALQSLPFFSELSVLYQTRPIPNLGMVSTNSVAPADRDRFSSVLTGMCREPEGAGICKSFGIEGFAAAAEADYEALRSTYQGGQKK